VIPLLQTFEVQDCRNDNQAVILEKHYVNQAKLCHPVYVGKMVLS
jgi:hypothetical protein